MPNFNWTTQNVQYVVKQFGAGVSPAEILSQLQSSGCKTLRLVHIEQCLRSNGRIVNVYNSRISHFFPGNTSDVREHQDQLINPARDSFVGGNQGPIVVSVPPSGFSSQINPGRGWDSAADWYVILAHHDGRSVVNIWGDLIRDGYGVKVSEVAASLTRQGVDRVKIKDYLVN
ncbi:hypothetical protein MMC31_003094 [Peltigera leucophlebia]|nr:hypothetical protein [Peltigera leucophlebia]